MARYTDEFRAHAVIMLEMEGYPEHKGALIRVAKALKCSSTNLHRWFHNKSNPPPTEIVTIKKEQIVEMLANEIYHAIIEMGKTRQDADYKELAVAMGIMSEKMELLSGQPTERVAHELSDSERSERVAAILERGRQERTRLLTDGSSPLH